VSNEGHQPPGAPAPETFDAPPSPARRVARCTVVLAVFAACAWLGLKVAFAGTNVSLFWLPSGVAVAALLLWGRAMLVPLAVAVLVTEGLIGVPWAWAAPVMAAGCCGGYWIASRVLVAGRVDPAFGRLVDFRTLARAALVGMLLPPTTGVGALVLAGIVPADRMLGAWVAWYAGDVLGVVLAVPLLLALNAACTGPSPPWRVAVLTAPERRTELRAAAGAALLVVVGVALSLVARTPNAPEGLAGLFALQLAVAAGATWLGLLGAWATLVAVAVAVAVPAALGVGPFVRTQPDEGPWVAWLFLALATALATTALGARRRFERTQARLALRERQLRAMFEQSNAAISVSERGRHVMVNDAFCAMLGQPREALLGHAADESTHPEDRHLHAAALRRWAAGEGGTVFEMRHLHRDGRVVWARVALSVLQSRHGEPPQVVSVMLDITEHKRVEASLRRQREQLALVFSATGSGIWDHDLALGRSFHSDSYLQMLGHPPGTPLPRLAQDPTRIHPDDRVRMLSDLTAMFERRVPLDGEYQLRRADGGHLWVAAHGFAVWNDAGVPVRSYGTITDISARKAAEVALVESRARLSAVIDSAHDAIVAIDDRGRVVLFNAAAEAMFGRPAADVLGRSFLPMVPPRLRGEAMETVRRVALDAAGGVGGGRTLGVLHADGTEFPVESTLAPVTVDGGTLYTLVMRDARERRRIVSAERARAEAEAASRAKSDFLSRMSHELRTPLNAVLGFAQLMEIDADAPLASAQRERLRAIREAGGHLGALIDELLDLTRIESDRLKLRHEPIDVPAVCRQSLRLVSLAAAEAGVRLVGLPDDGPSLAMHGDPTRVRQVLVNLLSNAVKYNRRGGTVRLSAGEDAGRWSWIEVEDDGPGIAPADRERLFEPFERLGREHGSIEGSGIGLALSRRLVELMGGRIEVDSEPGRGSRFRVRLPSAPWPAVPPTAPAAPGRPASVA
jgi:PAS domain S-box-containing protein